MSSPFALKHFIVERLLVEADIENMPTEEAQYVPWLQLDQYQRSENAFDYKLRLSVRLSVEEGKRLPIPRCEFTISAIFSISADWPDTDQARELLFRNGPAVIYGIARGVVASATGTMLRGPLILPTINMTEYFGSEADSKDDSQMELSLPVNGATN